MPRIQRKKNKTIISAVVWAGPREPLPPEYKDLALTDAELTDADMRGYAAIIPADHLWLMKRKPEVEDAEMNGMARDGIPEHQVSIGTVMAALLDKAGVHHRDVNNPSHSRILFVPLKQLEQALSILSDLTPFNGEKLAGGQYAYSLCRYAQSDDSADIISSLQGARIEGEMLDSIRTQLFGKTSSVRPVGI